MATTQARYGEIIFNNGRVLESKYNDCRLVTISDACIQTIHQREEGTSPSPPIAARTQGWDAGFTSVGPRCHRWAFFLGH